LAKTFIHDLEWIGDHRRRSRLGESGLKDFVTQRSAALALAALLACSFFGTAARADETGVPVTITRFDHSGLDYTLVVTPAKTDPPDPYMGACDRFEVRGTYGLLRGAKRMESWLSRQVHRDTLEFLQHAFISGVAFDLGWVGTGFIPVEEGKPCVVKSRALRLVKDDAGTHVLSYHDAVPTQ
jgi:hypothetical protein